MQKKWPQKSLHTSYQWNSPWLSLLLSQVRYGILRSGNSLLPGLLSILAFKPEDFKVMTGKYWLFKFQREKQSAQLTQQFGKGWYIYTSPKDSWPWTSVHFCFLRSKCTIKQHSEYFCNIFWVFTIFLSQRKGLEEWAKHYLVWQTYKLLLSMEATLFCVRKIKYSFKKWRKKKTHYNHCISKSVRW